MTGAIPSGRAGVVALLYVAGAVATANGDQIYWAQTVGNQIKRSDLDGAKVEAFVEWPWVDGPVAISLGPSQVKEAIPAVSDWGLVVCALLLTTAGTLVLKRRSCLNVGRTEATS